MEVKIEEFDHFGRGISKDLGKVCFIEDALKDEVIEIKIIKDKKKYLEGEVLKVKRKSPKRRSSSCPYFPLCGGCNLRYMSDDLQREFKIKKVENILKKYSDIKVKVQDIVFSKEEFYRNKVVFHVKDHKLGFYKKNTHDLIEIDKCLSLHQKINELIPKLKEISLKNYLEKIMVRVGNYQDEVLISITGKVVSDINIGDVLYINDKLMTKKAYITSCFNDKKYLISNQDFFQVNDKITKKLYDEVLACVKKIKAFHVLDLYCGSGTIGIYISDVVDHVLGVEVVSEAIKKAHLNKKLNKTSNISFKEGKVEDVIKDIRRDFDTIICDPPRSGLAKSVLEFLKDSKASNIIYISCDPVTLARDLKQLKATYKVEYIKVYDMFKNTYHLESFVYLKKCD